MKAHDRSFSLQSARGSMSWVTAALLVGLGAFAAGCGDRAADGGAGDGHMAGAQAGENAFIDVPADVRKNLGVKFGAVERRVVRKLLRVPGNLELAPDARREHRVAVEGRIRLSVGQYQAVTVGDELLRVESPGWRRMQHEAVEAEGEIQVAEAQLAVAEARLEEARRTLSVLDDRLRALAEAGSRNAPLEAERAIAETRVPRLEAERHAARVSLAEAGEHLASRMQTLSVVSGIPVDELLTRVQSAGGADVAKFRTIDDLPLVAEIDGVVAQIDTTEGGWLSAGQLALVLIQPNRLRFHGDAPVSELPNAIQDEQVTLIPPRGGPVERAGSWTGRFTRAPVANPTTRTVHVLLDLAEGDRPQWIQAGVAAFLEIVVDGDATAELAIPKRALVRDGLRTYFFVRDPKDPDHVRAVDADLGVDDGWWVEVRSGLADGDEVVVDGAYALELATGGGPKAPPGFHYHADGTLHADH